MYCPKCGFRSDSDARSKVCPRCGPPETTATATRPRSKGRTAVAAEHRGFSRGFKLTIAAIGLFVSTMLSLPYFFPLPSRQPSGETASSERSRHRDTASGDSSVAAPTPSPRPSTVSRPAAREAIPELPRLDGSTATPALLARAKELARKHPDESWLRQYVVNALYWLARRATQERRFEEAVRYLDDSLDWGGPLGDVATYRAIVYRDQEAWELAERSARTAIAHDSKIDPAEMHHVIGKAHYFREELDWAIEELERALAIAEKPHIRASLELARRDSGASEGFSRRRLSHFIVSYEGETMETTGRMAINTLERSYASLVSQLGFEPNEPVPVILYTRRSYSQVSGGGQHLSAGLFDGKIRLPVRDVHWGDVYIQRVLHHELSHAFFHSRTGGHDPRWFNEGLAEYVEGVRTTEVARRLAPILAGGRTLEGCLLSARYGCDVFYPAAASLVDYMVDLRGMGGIREVVSDLGEGIEINRALQRVLGRDERSLIRDWEHFIRRRF